jgi:D-beta-D-heptose 7-phosphate kinase / D-beta-D-heptose 1-phosphate adenosyltransferase
MAVTATHRVLPVPAALARQMADSAPSVVVLGDAVLDAWLTGPAHRVGREAPVPVVELRETDYAPGGAANMAANLAALGGRVELLAVLGDDPAADLLRDALVARGVGISHSPVEAGRVTPVKRRLMAGGQIVARFDDGPRSLPSQEAQSALAAALEVALTGEVAAVVVADYGLGTISERIRDILVHRGGVPLVVDAHDLAAWQRCAPQLVTPSFGEAAAVLGATAPEEERIAWVSAHADELVECCGAEDVLVTLDIDGALLVPGQGAPMLHASALTAVPGASSCGAGDTFAAAATLARCVGSGRSAMLAVAQAAADVVVARPGTAVCDTAALIARLAHADRGAILHPDDLIAVVEEHRRVGHRVVFTNGCFDVLHRGHVAYLRQARALGDVLIVALNTDDSVARLKGPQRPVNPLVDRAGVVGALDAVDLVTSFGEDSPVALLTRVRPDVYAKGGDYTPQMLPETPVVERLGGQVRVLDYLSDHSTTAIVDRIRTAP